MSRHMKYLLISVLVTGSLLWAAPAKADIAAGLKAREAERWEQALTEFKKDLKSEQTRFEANWHLGETLVMIGEPKAALEFLEAAVAENSEHANAQYWWGAANGEVAGKASIFSAAKYAKACRKAFEKAVALDPDHLDAREGLMQYYLEAPGFLGGDQDKALEQAKEIMARNKERGYLNMAAVYQNQKDPTKALEAYNDLLMAYPKSTRGLFMRGLMHRKNKRFEEAYSDFRTLAAINPAFDIQDPKAAAYRVRLGLYFMGAVSSQAKIHVTDGINSLRAFLATDDFDIPARKGYGQYYLATLYLADGNLDEARSALMLAMKVAKDKDLKKKLKKLRKQIKKLI